MSVFENQENAFGVVEPTVESQYIWVAKSGLNLHFSLELVLNFVLFYLLFEYHLQRHYVFALPKTQNVRDSDSEFCLGNEIKSTKNKQTLVLFSSPWLLWRDRLGRISLFRGVFRSRSLARTIASLVIGFRISFLFVCLDFENSEFPVWTRREREREVNLNFLTVKTPSLKTQTELTKALFGLV